MDFSTGFIKRPIATSLVMAGLFLVGLATYPLLPVAPLPQVDFPTITVWTNLPGASPETMAATVAAPLEQQFAAISGVSQMTSISSLGNVQITVQFDLNRNIDGAAQDIQAAINAAGGQLPKNLPNPPNYRKTNPADAPFLMLGVSSDVLPVNEVDNYAETILAQQLSQIPGVGQVDVGGAQKPAVRVQIDPAKIAALGLQLEDVASVITIASVNAPKGALMGQLHNFAIYDNDQLTRAAPWNDVVVAYRKGAPVRIRDIGVAVDGPENSQSRAWVNGKPSVFLMVHKQPGANVIEAKNRIEATLSQITLALPPSVHVVTIADRTATIKASVTEVQRTLLISIALVVLVIFLFLRTLWATVIPGLTVPLSLMGASALMYLLGYSIDNLSLMALTIAVGFVVDDAIVMLENIHRHIEGGLAPMEAAIKGAREIGFTILSISVSLVAVFIPLLLMGGIFGRLFREFAVTVALTIAVSAFVALTLSPMMCARFLRDEKHRRHGRLYRIIEAGFDRLLAGYARGLDWVLDRQGLTLAGFFVTLAVSVGLFLAIPKGFFPQQDTGNILGISEASQDVSALEMGRLQQQLNAVIASDPDVSGWASAFGNAGRPANNGFVSIALKPVGQRKATVDQVIARLRARFMEVKGATIFLQAAQDISVGGRPARTQYQYTLQDPDLDELNFWAPQLLARLKTMPQLRDVASDQQTGGGMLSLTIDRDQAARFGIQPALIDQTLYDAFGQRQVAQYFTQANSYHVVLEVTPSLQGDSRTLEKIHIRSPVTGGLVPISTFAKFDTQHTALLTINHQGQFPAVTLSFNLGPGTALGDAVDAIDKGAAEIGLPPTVSGAFQGVAQAFQASLKSEPYLILAALVSVYIILGILYESYIHPLTILSTLPSAGVGALLMLLLFHIDFSVIALIGVILLIGIVKKNGIMMVDFALQAEREQHLAPREAIRQACLLRFRPIMMTTMAALLGALPLMLGNGTGAELRRPLGTTMVGGLLVSQALTLFSTPVVYLYLDRFSLWLGRRRKVGAETPAQAPAGE